MFAKMATLLEHSNFGKLERTFLADRNAHTDREFCDTLQIDYYTVPVNGQSELDLLVKLKNNHQFQRILQLSSNPKNLKYVLRLPIKFLYDALNKISSDRDECLSGCQLANSFLTRLHPRITPHLIKFLAQTSYKIMKEMRETMLDRQLDGGAALPINFFKLMNDNQLFPT